MANEGDRADGANPVVSSWVVKLAIPDSPLPADAASCLVAGLARLGLLTCPIDAKVGVPDSVGETVRVLSRSVCFPCWTV